MKQTTLLNHLIRNAPTILSALGMAGVIGTTALAVRATPKAVEKIKEDSIKNHDDPEAYTIKEAIKSAWKYYVPTATIGISTIVCIASSNMLSTKQQASITSAYALLNSSYKQYENKLKELYGEEVHNSIIDAIAKDECKDVYLYGNDLMGATSLDFDEHDPGDEKLFYDRYSNRYFQSTVNRVMQAEYYLNRDYTLAGAIELNRFYEYLGLEGVQNGDRLGWTCADGIYWLDFNHQKAVLDDGLEVYIIDMSYTPDFDWEDA